MSILEAYDLKYVAMCEVMFPRMGLCQDIKATSGHNVWEWGRRRRGPGSIGLVKIAFLQCHRALVADQFGAVLQFLWWDSSDMVTSVTIQADCAISLIV